MSWVYALGFALLSVVLVGSLWTIPYLPTNDGPEAVLAVHMENHYGDPGTIYQEVFEPAPQFAGRGFTVLFEPLEDSLGWQRGLQVALSVMVLLEAWGLVVLVRALDPRRLPLAFLGFPLALSWSIYMGFFAFVVASGVGLFVLAYACSAPPPTPGRRAVLALLLLLQAFFHMFAAILTGVVIAVFSVAKAARGKRIAELAKISLTGVPAAGLALTAFLVARKAAVKSAFAEDLNFQPLLTTVSVWPRTLAPGPLGRALVVTVLVAVCMVFAGVRAARRDTSQGDRALAGVALAFMLTAFFGPRDIPGWQCFSERFIWLGVLLLVAVLPFERIQSARIGRGIAVLAFTGSLVSILLSYPFHKRLAAASSDAIAGLSARIQRSRVWLPVTLEPSGPPLVPLGESEVPLVAPLRHIAALYATVEGGLTPYTFASNVATWPFALRRDAIHPPPVPPIERYVSLLSLPEFQTDRAFRHEEQNELATFGMYYEGVLLTGARPDDQELWRRRGYVADWEQGSAMVGHFVPCAIEVTLPVGAPKPLLDVGFGASTILRNVEPPVISNPDGSTQLVLAQGPCGHVWVKPHWDTPEPDGQVGMAFCENAKANGEISTLVTRTAGRFLCTAVGPVSQPSP